MEALAPWFFFALDHVNYSRWIPIHIRDMKSLPPGVKEQLLKDFWVIQKTQNKFNSLPLFKRPLPPKSTNPNEATIV